MLEFIDHLVDWSTGVPLIILCTTRPELYESALGWGGGKRNSTTISLSPLTDSETAQLISGLLSQAVLPAKVHAALSERAGGNPLYAGEFVRMLSDKGLHQRKSRVLSLEPDADIPMPETVQALIAARCVIASGRNDDALPRLHAAREKFAKLGAHPLLDEVDSHLVRATTISS